jgi:hypothetical protein
MLKQFLSFRLDIETLLDENDKVVAEISDGKWLLGLTFAYGIIHHLHDLNTKLQSQYKLIYNMIRGSHKF